jgi:hypothetical protein
VFCCCSNVACCFECSACYSVIVIELEFEKILFVVFIVTKATLLLVLHSNILRKHIRTRSLEDVRQLGTIGYSLQFEPSFVSLVIIVKL